MTEKKRNRIFWLEGITERTVLNSLNDRTPSRFRQQAARRRLVVTMAVLIFALAVQILLPTTKLQSYIEFALLAVAFTVYVLLYIAHDVQRDLSVDSDRTALGFMSLLISAAMLAGSLPAMVLAWNLPSEPAVED